MELWCGDDEKDARHSARGGSGVGGCWTQQGRVAKPAVLTEHNRHAICTHSAHMTVHNQVKFFGGRSRGDDYRVLGMFLHDKQRSKSGQFGPGLLPIDRLKQGNLR